MNADTLRIVGTALATTFLMGVPAFLYVSLTSDRFLVTSCIYSRARTEPDYSRTRGCLGYRYTPEMRGAYFVRCVGIPIGPWRCRATLPDERGSWEVPCH